VSKVVESPEFSVVVCTQNRAKPLDSLLFPSLVKVRDITFEVVLVDDNSNDSTRDVVKKWSDRLDIVYVENRKRRGLSFVRNLGIKNSCGEFIVFTDDDCEVSEKWLSELRKAYVKKSIVYVGGPAFVRNTRRYYCKGCGCNMSFRRDIFKRFLFDPNVYFLRSSMHDEEMLDRILDAGYEASYAPKAFVRDYELPAPYRRVAVIGGSLNNVYGIAKRVRFREYLRAVMPYYFGGKKDNSRIMSRLNEGMMTLSESKKLWSFIFTIFITIPLKAHSAKTSHIKLLQAAPEESISSPIDVNKE